MTKRGWVRVTFRGLETDHVPVCFWKHVPQELWQEDRFIGAQANFYKRTDVGSVKLSADGHPGWPVPALERLEQAKDLYQMKTFGLDHPLIGEQIHRTKRIISALKNECCCLYLIFCPLSYLRLGIGYLRMMELIREGPGAVKHACRVITGDVKFLIRGIIERAECNGIFYSIQNGEVNRLTYEEYGEWVTSNDREVLDYANILSDMNALHCCAWEEINNRLEDWSGCDSVVVSWSRYIDGLGVSQAKDTPKHTVWDGSDSCLGSLLYSDIRKEIQVETKAFIEEGGRRRSIVEPDCSIHDELPLERIRQAVETARSAQQSGSAGRRDSIYIANEYQADKERYEYMEYDRCGKGGLKLPCVSLGLWHNFGSEDNHGTMETMCFTAFDHGITHSDLANNYDPVYGSAEENFGRIMGGCLKLYREELLVSTEVDYGMWPGPYGDGGSRKYLISNLDVFLKRMKLGYVDISYHRRMDPDTPVEETALALGQIVGNGRALYIGVSNYDGEHTRETIRVAWGIRLPLVINQNSYNIFSRTIEENGLREYTARGGMGIIAFSPLAQEMLTGGYINGIPADSRTVRDGRFLHTSGFTTERVEQVRRLGTIVRERRQALAQVALPWVLKDEVVTSALIRTSGPERIIENLGIVGDTHFSQVELDEVNRISK